MNKKKRNVIMIAIVIIIVVVIIGVVLTIFFVNKQKNKPEDKDIQDPPIKELDDGRKINTRTNLNSAKLVNGLFFSDIQLTEKNGVTTLLASVSNKTGMDTDLKRLEIVFLDELGNEVGSTVAFLNGIKAGESAVLNVSAVSNYIDVYDFKIIEN